MSEVGRWGLMAAAALALTACQDNGPPETAMESAWLAWAGQEQVLDFEKVSCEEAGETRWLCRFRTRHHVRRGGRRMTLVANRSGYYQFASEQWTYHGK